MNKKKDHIDEFIYALHETARYWHDLEGKTEMEKIEGAIFSTLCILDGVSGSFKGNIETIELRSKGMMLHEEFYKNRQ